jgi:hypothetical protein
MPIMCAKSDDMNKLHLSRFNDRQAIILVNVQDAQFISKN